MKSDIPTPRSATQKRCRTGKIARLPKTNRDAINRMLQDGVPHQEIIDSLGELGRQLGLNHHHLIRWKQDGYQDWLKEQQPVDEVQAEKDSTVDPLKPNGGTDIHETTLRLAASQIHQILKGFRIQKDLLEKDPKNYAAIANSLAKLSKSALDIEMFKESVAEQRHQRQVELDKDKKPRGLTRETIKKMEEALHLL